MRYVASTALEIGQAFARYAQSFPNSLTLRSAATKTGAATTSGLKKATSAEATQADSSSESSSDEEGFSFLDFSCRIQVLEAGQDSFLCRLHPVGSSAAVVSKLFSENISNQSTQQSKVKGSVKSSGKATVGAFQTGGKRRMAPAYPKSSYHRFTADHWHQEYKANPELSGREMHAHMGKLWKEMDYADKAKYLDAAAADRQKYLKDLVKPVRKGLAKKPAQVEKSAPELAAEAAGSPGKPGQSQKRSSMRSKK